MEDRFICICCKRRKDNTRAYIKEEYTGICTDCRDKLAFIPKGTIFPGNDYINSVFSAFEYKGIIRDTIKRYKFNNQQRYRIVLVELLYDYLKDFHLEKDFDYITSIPLSRKRLIERGYNQTELLAKPLAEKLGIPFIGNAVFKKYNNNHQSKTKHLSDRFKNVEGVYLADIPKVQDKNILLLDDILTTGATMTSCAKELIEKGAGNVTAITLAKVIIPPRKTYLR